MDDGIQINLSSGPEFSHEKKAKESKQARLKKKRDERRQRNDHFKEVLAKHSLNNNVSKKEQTNSSTTAAIQSKTPSNMPSPAQGRQSKPSSDKPLKKKRKAEDTADAEPGTKHAKFSSLFKNNPEIPSVQMETMASVSETVFSDKEFSMDTLHPYMVSNLKSKMGISEMTSVQQAAIPHVMARKDTLVKSQTGSGKTLTYAVPIIQHLQALQPKVQRSDGTYAVVIVPTRELALQVLDTFQKLVQPFTWIVPGSIMGGEKRKSEKARLRKGMNVLVSTPGRLCDHMEKTSCLNISPLKWLVIDEADRLLDMGFEKEVKRFLEYLDQKEIKRQTVLVSATLSAGVEQLAGMSLSNPVKVDMSGGQAEKKPPMSKGKLAGKLGAGKKEDEEVFALPQSLKHHFVIVPQKLRLVTLAAFLLQHCKKGDRGVGKTLVFVSTQEAVELLFTLLGQCLVASDYHMLSLARLHGDMPQQQRTEAFNKFSSAKAGVLICTDVAARGLDLPHVQWIVQYTAPASATDYIHRAGRTARIGSHGQALLFLAPAEAQYAKTLQEGIKISFKEMPMNKILGGLIQEADLIRREGKATPITIEECATALQMRFEDYVSGEVKVRTLARKAFQSFVRAYATYPSALKSIFHIKNLHLGHLAKSFALQDSPKHIGDIIHNHKAAYASTRKDKKDKKPMKKKYKKLSQMSEFDSGI